MTSSEPIDSDSLDALEAAAEAATPGPWVWRGDYPRSAGCVHGTDWADHGPDLGGPDPKADPILRASGYDASTLHVSDADAEFIVAANPSAVLALTAEVKRLRAVVQACADARAAWNEHDEGCEYATKIQMRSYAALEASGVLGVVGVPDGPSPEGCDCP